MKILPPRMVSGVADLEILLGQADKALYRAMELGRNRVEVF